MDTLDTLEDMIERTIELEGARCVDSSDALDHERWRVYALENGSQVKITLTIVG